MNMSPGDGTHFTCTGQGDPISFMIETVTCIAQGPRADLKQQAPSAAYFDVKAIELYAGNVVKRVEGLRRFNLVDDVVDGVSIVKFQVFHFKSMARKVGTNARCPGILHVAVGNNTYFSDSRSGRVGLPGQPPAYSQSEIFLQMVLLLLWSKTR